MKVSRKLVVIGIVAVIVLAAYGPASLSVRSAKLLSGLFSSEESDYFQLHAPKVFVLDENTNVYIFKPETGDGKYPAMIFSLGLWENATDPRLQNAVHTFVDNGFVVELVESRDTLDGYLTANGSKSLVTAFKHLQRQDYVQDDKIGFFGISVGSSLAYIAASDPEIKDDALFILWLGGYYDSDTYLADVLSGTTVHNGQVIEYDADPRVVGAAMDNIEHIDPELGEMVASTADREKIIALLGNASAKSREKLNDISPKLYDIDAKVFVIHDISDQYVPFTQSIELDEKKSVDAYVQTEIIRHAVPRVDVQFVQFAKEFSKLILLTNAVLALVDR